MSFNKESMFGAVGPQDIPWRALARAQGPEGVAKVKEIVFTAADHRTAADNAALDQAQFMVDKKAREQKNRSMAHGVRLPSTRGPQHVYIAGNPRR